MDLKKISEGVYMANGEVAEISGKELSLLRRTAASSPKGRSRICAHRSLKDQVQEMVIAVPRGCYIRPHKHLGKSESMHAIEGSADVVIFNDKGKAIKVFRISAPGRKGVFYYRINKSVYHTIIVRSGYYIFHESTGGPFLRSASVAAPWAPDEKNAKEGLKFLKKAIAGIRK